MFFMFASGVNAPSNSAYKTSSASPLGRRLSSQLWKYLGWLARTTLLGRNENEVARQVLTEKLAEMRQEDYRDGQKP